MAKEQVEGIIAKATPQDGERIRKGLEHLRTLCDLNGNHIPHEFEKENLRDVISKRDMYIIDTNSTWHKECKKPENLNKAFIITPALARETTNLLDLILDKTRSKLGNIFSIGIDHRINCFIIERIDEAFQYEFNIPMLKEASKGKGPFFEKQKAEHSVFNIEEKKRATFNIELELLFDVTSSQPPVSKKFWTTSKACDLPTPGELKYATDRLKITSSKGSQLVGST